MQKYLLTGVLVIVAVAMLAFILNSNSQKNKTVQQAQPTANEDKNTENVQTTIIEIKNFAFVPEKMTIKKGTKVKFINRDDVKHNAVAQDGTFETALLGKDEEAEVMLDRAGVYKYHCAPHPNMQATLIVE